jgi:peroxiredoxin
MSRRAPILIVAAVVAIGIGIAAYGMLSGRTAAPDVQFVSLKGEKITTADLRGRVVLVNFWATDCATCIREMPQLVATYNKYRQRGFETIAVAMRHDPPNYVIQYVERNALPFRIALDPMGGIARAFGDVRFTPTTFVIDRRGNIVARIPGEPDFSKLHRLIEEKLEESWPQRSQRTQGETEDQLQTVGLTL